MIDPGHGGVDNGTQAGGDDIMEKNLVLSFGLALRDRIEKSGKYRVVMTRTDDTFIPLGDRVKIARNRVGGAVRLDPCRRLAARRGRRPGRHHLHAVRQGLRRRGRAAGGRRKQVGRDRRGQSADEPTEVADILIDLVQRETQNLFQTASRGSLMGEMKNTVRMHKHPLKSAGFRVLKAPDVPSVLVELGYVSNKGRPRTSGVGKLAEPDGRIDGAGN